MLPAWGVEQGGEWLQGTRAGLTDLPFNELMNNEGTELRLGFIVSRILSDILRKP